MIGTKAYDHAKTEEIDVSRSPLSIETQVLGRCGSWFMVYQVGTRLMQERLMGQQKRRE